MVCSRSLMGRLRKWSPIFSRGPNPDTRRLTESFNGWRVNSKCGVPSVRGSLVRAILAQQDKWTIVEVEVVFSSLTRNQAAITARAHIKVRFCRRLV
jgi:hypothetical protein